MKRMDILLLIIVATVSAILFNVLQGKLSTGYIAFIISCFGLSIGLISNFLSRITNKE